MTDTTTDVVRHVVRIKHDPESHEIEDCHDDCTAEVICLGTTDACRTWWECRRCMRVLSRVDQAGAFEYDDRVDERGGVAHGVDHQRIDGMWMTPSETCLSRAAEDDDSYDLIYDLADGDHPVTIDYEEGYLSVLLRDTSNMPDQPVAGGPS